MNTFTIKDIEKLSGIKAHTIRIWEQRYQILSPQRTDTNIRYYSNEDLKTVLNISLLNKCGYKISRIKKMDTNEIQEKILSLNNVLAQQERIINELIQYMVDMNVDAFENVLDAQILNTGISNTIIDIIFPFLDKTGVLWQTNHINPAQEHLVTNIIRQKLIIGIENALVPYSLNKTVLIFLPENEHHELGLLFIHYLFKQRGFKVLYLGANIPIRDVANVVSIKQPTLLYCHLTAVSINFNLENYLIKITHKIPNIKMVFSGKIVQMYKKSVPANVEFKKTLVDAMAFIENG